MARIVTQIRAAWPEVRIIVRADSGFCREELMTWCEEHGMLQKATAKNEPRKRVTINGRDQQASAGL